MNKKLEEAMEEALIFQNIEIDEVEYNAGSIWVTDKNSKKKYFIMIGKVEE